MKYIIGNWKCNPANKIEAKKYFWDIKGGQKSAKAKAVICPPACYLELAREILKIPRNWERKIAIGKRARLPAKFRRLN